MKAYRVLEAESKAGRRLRKLDDVVPHMERHTRPQILAALRYLARLGYAVETEAAPRVAAFELATLEHFRGVQLEHFRAGRLELVRDDQQAEFRILEAVQTERSSARGRMAVAIVSGFFWGGIATFVAGRLLG